MFTLKNLIDNDIQAYISSKYFLNDQKHVLNMVTGKTKYYTTLFTNVSIIKIASFYMLKYMFLVSLWRCLVLNKHLVFTFSIPKLYIYFKLTLMNWYFVCINLYAVNLCWTYLHNWSLNRIVINLFTMYWSIMWHCLNHIFY